ncbi:MAG: alpha/beta hydrolase [Phycisphaerae bacterium]|nr:alpha/beta hydrolase [Phycisphaerae bacterium]
MTAVSRRSIRQGCAVMAAIVLAGGAAGCSVRDLGTTDRMSRGLIVILPGIEGRGPYNYSLARGLDEGGVTSAIEIFDWNVPVPGPGGALINLTDYERNKNQASRLAQRVIAYQDAYPGRAVHLIGHSGGGGLAVLALESMPRNRQVTAALLLAASISPNYDLRPALRRTKYGIFNYHSSADISFLTVGTTLFGNIDRGYGPAAGAVGFKRPKNLDAEGEALYARLHDIRWTRQMAHYGNPGSHIGWTSSPFVRKYLAPLIVEQQANPFGSMQLEDPV